MIVISPATRARKFLTFSLYVLFYRLYEQQRQNISFQGCH